MLSQRNVGKLYIVPTPIGNLKDITLRAIEVLKNVQLILAEDTRTSGILLKRYDIHTTTTSFHAFNEHKKIEQILSGIEKGQQVALISDAGTPGISDPGYLIISEALHRSIEVEVLVGANAFVPALLKSGFPCDRFIFEGFLPPKKGRNKRLLPLGEESKTMIFYESPHRLEKTLLNFKEVFGDQRMVSVSREISKKFEETINGTVEMVIEHFSKKKPKGEFVIIVRGKN